MDVRLFYVDDSGARDTGWVVYGWVEVLITDWRPALKHWLAWREALAASDSIPKRFEIHMTKFAGGRGRPSNDEKWNGHKRRPEIVGEALDTLVTMPKAMVGSVYSKVNRPSGSAYVAEQARVYQELVLDFDRRVGVTNDFGVVIMDGAQGGNGHYVAAHRHLDIDTRNIIEDPCFYQSHSNQWVQMADIVAFCAYQHLARIPSKEDSWDWYPKLVTIDVNAGPKKVPRKT